MNGSKAAAGCLNLHLLRMLALLLGMAASPFLHAQHAMHGMSASGTAGVTTMPADNEILVAAPASIMLHFDAEVRLVKLALREASQGLLDIGFRYRPAAGLDFVQELPALAQADYYAVEWAALDAAGRLMKGRFFFSFGPDARAPSYYLEQLDHPLHIMTPDYRLQ